jgi:hypothetical protein
LLVVAVVAFLAVALEADLPLASLMWFPANCCRLSQSVQLALAALRLPLVAHRHFQLCCRPLAALPTVA